MGFAGSVGKLMQNIGLEKVMMSTLAGIDIMLLGKKFPKKIWALRFAVVELLLDHVCSMNKSNVLGKFLDDISSKSCLAKHWVRNLIKPMLLMVVYVRAKREG